MGLLKSEIVEWGDNPSHALVIWLHGLGASGEDFVPVVDELGIPPSVGITFVFPHAPKMPVTLNGGFVMPAWYDIYDLSRQEREDVQGIANSIAQIEALMVHYESRGFLREKMVLAGFSQGGVIALTTALKQGGKIAGVMGLSTYLPRDMSAVEAAIDSNSVPKAIHSTDHAPFAFIAHGTHDDIVPLTFAQSRFEWLASKDVDYRLETYKMAHEVCMPEIKAIGRWLSARLGE